MINRCKLNPCCGDQRDCDPPPQFDGSYWDKENKKWIVPKKDK